MTTVNQTWPPVASVSNDTYNPSVALIGGGHVTQSYTMPANKAVVQYEIVKLVAGGIVQLAADPAAGDVLGIMCYAADNLTATAAGARTTAAHVYVSGVFNENALVYVSGTTPDECRAIARACGLILKNPLVRN